MKYIKPIFESKYLATKTDPNFNKLEKLYDEIESLTYLLEDENLPVSVNIIDIKIEVIYRSLGVVSGKVLQDRMDAIQEFNLRCLELCDEYNFNFLSRSTDSKTRLIVISPR